MRFTNVISFSSVNVMFKTEKKILSKTTIINKIIYYIEIFRT